MKIIILLIIWYATTVIIKYMPTHVSNNIVKILKPTVTARIHSLGYIYICETTL